MSASPTRGALTSNIRLGRGVLALTVLLAVGVCLPARAVANDMLPLRRVVLFSSGVAFFEHQGEVEGDAAIDLLFRTEDINDLLKSMVLEDLGGGRVAPVGYDSLDPLSKTLESFAVDLRAQPSLAQLLAQLRGEDVEVESSEHVTGTILGLEQRPRPQVEGPPVPTDYLNLLTETGLRSLALDQVTRIRLMNPKLDAELRQALRVLAAGHATDKKRVTLRFSGQGRRPVRVGYILASPVWKTSYRLVLKDGQPALLQGWAIVENTTDRDWTNVDLTLVSGRPVSFHMDLYQPLYVERPRVLQELFANLSSQRHDQDLLGFSQNVLRGQVAQLMRRRDVAGGRTEREAGAAQNEPNAGAKPNDAPGESDVALPELLAQDERGQAFFAGAGVEALAQASEVGELFQYVIDMPVSLPRQQSAMLPIVQAPVTCEKMSLYNPGVHAKHPLNGLKLVNSTGLHLMHGPITVFDGGSYAGDAQIDDLPASAERLVSYAMDLDTEGSTTGQEAARELVNVRITRGVLLASHKLRRTQKYLLKNSADMPRRVLVEQAVDPAWTLRSPEKPAQQTRGLYRFEVTVEPAKTAELAVTEEQTTVEEVQVGNLDDAGITFYLRTQVVNERVKQSLAELVRRKQQLHDVTTRRSQLEATIQTIDNEQNRIRQNMPYLDRASELFNRYVKKLTAQEGEIESLRAQIAKLQQEETSLQKSLDEYLATLSVE